MWVLVGCVREGFATALEDRVGELLNGWDIIITLRAIFGKLPEVWIVDLRFKQIWSHQCAHTRGDCPKIMSNTQAASLYPNAFTKITASLTRRVNENVLISTEEYSRVSHPVVLP